MMLDDVRDEFKKFEESLLQSQTDFWNDLTKDQQLMAFCYVVHTLRKAELEDNHSYRGVLYNAFGFDLDSYVCAQVSGFLDLHNAIYSEADLQQVKHQAVQNLEYETVNRCVAVIQNAVDQRIPASEYVKLLKQHFRDEA